MTRGWPATLREGRIGLRPIRLRDAAAWREVRRVNAEWLRPWEATLPIGETDAPMSFAGMVRRLRAEARDLKEALAEQMLENRLLKKSMIGDGGEDT